MPGPVLERDKLEQITVSFNQQMGGYPESGDRPERGIRMIRGNPVAEQVLDPSLPEASGWQADPVDDDEFDLAARWPYILIRRSRLARKSIDSPCRINGFETALAHAGQEPRASRNAGIRGSDPVPCRRRAQPVPKYRLGKVTQPVARATGSTVEGRSWHRFPFQSVTPRCVTEAAQLTRISTRYP